jgi:hypothetical protein
MVDRYLHGLDHTRPEPVLVGATDADEGPEGPPSHADGAV